MFNPHFVETFKKLDKKGQYEATVMFIATAANALADFDIPEVLQAIDRAEAFGPILDPTLWKSKNVAMGEDKELLEAALPLWRVGRKLAERRVQAELTKAAAGGQVK